MSSTSSRINLPLALLFCCWRSSALLFPPSYRPSFSNSSCLFTRYQPLICQLCTGLFKVLCYKMTNDLFIFQFVFLCIICVKKYYKPMQVSYYIADCVSWVPRLTLLDFQTNGVKNVLLEQSSFICRELAIWKSHRHPPLRIVETVRRGEGLSSPVKSPLFSLEDLSLHHTCSSPEWEGETGMTLVSMGREQVKTATCSTNPHSTSHLFPP